MSAKEGGVDRLALAVAAEVTAVLARAAEARRLALDRRLRPMRHVIDEFERRHGLDAQPGDYPTEFAELVARHRAGHLREHDVRLLHAAIIEGADRDCERFEALADLDEAGGLGGVTADGQGTMSLPAWAGVSKEQFSAAVNTALRSRPRSG